jgi:hypothetical protein
MLQGYNSGTNNMNNGWKVHGEFSITRIEYVRRSNAHLHVHVCQSKVNLSYSNDSNEGYVFVEFNLQKLHFADTQFDSTYIVRVSE